MTQRTPYPGRATTGDRAITADRATTAGRAITPGSQTGCRDCRHFRNGAAALEAALPGLRTLSSAYASVRCADGLCAVHDRYVAADYACSAHSSGPTSLSA